MGLSVGFDVDSVFISSSQIPEVDVREVYATQICVAKLSLARLQCFSFPLVCAVDFSLLEACNAHV